MSESFKLITPETHPDHESVGKFFHSWDGHIFWCDSYDPAIGYWMTRIDAPPGYHNEHWRKNISGRAIGLTFYRIDIDPNQPSRASSRFGWIDTNTLKVPVGETAMDAYIRSMCSEAEARRKEAERTTGTQRDWLLSRAAFFQQCADEAMNRQRGLKPFDLSDPTERDRLLRETVGNARVNMHRTEGIELEGRRYALEALERALKQGYRLVPPPSGSDGEPVSGEGRQ